jgi:hypothetical protein
MCFRALIISAVVSGLTVIATAQTTQSITAPADASTPKGALKALALALDAGDQPRIKSLMNVTSPMEQKMVDATSEMAVSIAKLKHAMSSKFGESATQTAMGDSPEVLQKSLATIDSAEEKVDGDIALVSLSATPREAMSLKKVSGSWKVSVADQVKDEGLTPPQVDEKMSMVTAQSKLLNDVTAEVESGKYATATDATAALRGKMSGGHDAATAPSPTK